MTIWAFFAALTYAFGALSLAMSGAWLIWLRTRNSGWVDTTWTFALSLISTFGALAGGGFSERAALVATCAMLWGARLGWHIADRTTGITDDPRYANLISGWRADAVRQMFWLLQKQAWVSIPLVLSIWLAAWNPVPALRIQDLLGALVIVTAIWGEGVADEQLKEFRANPTNRARVCDQGLWRFSRHPNYFFEWLGWLAYPVIAIDFHGSYFWGWLALGGPLCMYWLLVYVSGIPPLEEHMLARRGVAFREYQSRTNAFFPGPPRGAHEFRRNRVVR